MSRDAAKRAARAHKVPFIVEQEDLDAMPPFPFPELGTYIPKGWQKVQEYFVDSSGFGQEGEPALTVNQFIKKLVVGRGYAITEVGQFQLYVGEFIKVDETLTQAEVNALIEKNTNWQEV
jgi:hypothetical protein